MYGFFFSPVQRVVDRRSYNRLELLKNGKLKTFKPAINAASETKDVAQPLLKHVIITLESGIHL